MSRADARRARPGRRRRARSAPVELIRAVLLAPVDLLFNGGIGTYVKASTESDLDVGDKANDAVRVDGGQLRARVVGEGGNLGLTQRGRVEYALAGGRVNTDAIDNSAGVDTSDHEVNIKIALNGVVDRGGWTPTGRAALLQEMTDEVAVAVLTDNHAQNATLAVEVAAARSLLDAGQRFIRALERSGRLVRSVEALPDDRALAERRRDGQALTGPELSVLLAYAKLEAGDAVLALRAARRPRARAPAGRLLPGGAARAVPRRGGRPPAAPGDRGDRPDQPGGQRRGGHRAVPAGRGDRRARWRRSSGRTRSPARSSTSTGCGTPSGRWTTGCRPPSRWSCASRPPGWPSAARPLAAAAAASWPASRRLPIAAVTDRFAAPVAAVRAGPAGLAAGRRGRPPSPRGPTRLRDAGVPAELAAEVGGRPAACRPRSTSPSSPSGPGRRSSWPAG